MRLEHVALNVADPVAFARWYVKNLGFRVVRSSGAPQFAHFMADASGSVLLEVYLNARVRIPDYFTWYPANFHIAFASEDVRADRDRLLRAGASLVADVSGPARPGEDEVVMLRDPWGVPIQLAKRAAPML